MATTIGVIISYIYLFHFNPLFTVNALKRGNSLWWEKVINFICFFVLLGTTGSLAYLSADSFGGGLEIGYILFTLFYFTLMGVSLKASSRVCNAAIEKEEKERINAFEEGI